MSSEGILTQRLTQFHGLLADLINLLQLAPAIGLFYNSIDVSNTSPVITWYLHFLQEFIQSFNVFHVFYSKF